jgi:hypothetical protein
VHREDAYYGHLVPRLLGCLVLFYTSRVICKGQLTMELVLLTALHEQQNSVNALAAGV